MNGLLLVGGGRGVRGEGLDAFCRRDHSPGDCSCCLCCCCCCAMDAKAWRGVETAITGNLQYV